MYRSKYPRSNKFCNFRDESANYQNITHENPIIAHFPASGNVHHGNQKVATTELMTCEPRIFGVIRYIYIIHVHVVTKNKCKPTIEFY